MSFCHIQFHSITRGIVHPDVSTCAWILTHLTTDYSFVQSQSCCCGGSERSCSLHKPATKVSIAWYYSIRITSFSAICHSIYNANRMRLCHGYPTFPSAVPLWTAWSWSIKTFMFSCALYIGDLMHAKLSSCSFCSWYFCHSWLLIPCLYHQIPMIWQQKTTFWRVASIRVPSKRSVTQIPKRLRILPRMARLAMTQFIVEVLVKPATKVNGSDQTG